MNVAELKAKLAEVDDLLNAKVIDEARAKDWKDRILSDFDKNQVPGEKRPDGVMGTTDMKHLPGRIIGHTIAAMGKLAENAGKGYERLEERERQRRKRGEDDTPDWIRDNVR